MLNASYLGLVGCLLCLVRSVLASFEISSSRDGVEPASLRQLVVPGYDAGIVVVDDGESRDDGDGGEDGDDDGGETHFGGGGGWWVVIVVKN